MGHVNIRKINTCIDLYKGVVMLVKEVTENVIKPKTPQQQRIDSLKQQKDNVSKQLKAERDRQKIAKAQQTIQTAKTNLTSL